MKSGRRETTFVPHPHITRILLNLFKKLDRIPPPYSTILALLLVSSLGLFLIIWRDETRLLGLGIVAGGTLSIVFKAAAEVSDRETWQRIRRILGWNGHES